MTFIVVLNVQSQCKFWSGPSRNLEVLGKFIFIEVEFKKLVHLRVRFNMKSKY
jgi:hypothetical protein